MLNIRRVDHDASSTHCWRVTVQRRTRIFVRDFSDGRHGGRQPALQAAKVYRDKIVKAYPPLSKAAYCAIRKKNNRSGVSGLTRVDTWELYKGRRFRRLYWEAQWPIGHRKAQHKKFSITKYGEEEAYLRAFTARATALKALSTQTFSPFASGILRRKKAG
jgi:hypothetical protein